MVLTRDQILAATDVGREAVPVPEWGGDVYLRELSGAEMESISDDQAGGKKATAARILAMSICDEQGQALFAEADVEALRKKSGKVLTRLLNKALDMNGLTKKAQRATEKN